MESIFTSVYETNFWASSESRSGGGSTLESTQNLRNLLPELLKQLNVQTLLDAPCGDFNWMKEVDLSAISYFGADIVREMIQKNQTLYNKQNYTFLHADLTKDTLPKADLILCRWCLPHLSHADVMRTINNFKKSGSKYLLTTTYPAVKSNEKISSGGGHRFVNLQQPPFNFPAPRLLLLDAHHPESAFGDDYLGLWELADLPSYSAHWVKNHSQ
ncbi:MAG TPA: class I SAM-dependent methyltransferase [Rhabdochlamydiaceae bacterium]